MRRYLLLLLLLAGCKNLINKLGAEPCNDEQFVACVGDELQTCNPGEFLIIERCEEPLTCSEELASCSLCGNGDDDSGEECDDGNTTSGDGCRADCEGLEECGDGLLDSDLFEECDDDNNTNLDGCDAGCKIEPPQDCGDGIVNGAEECDDGNQSNNDGCSKLCLEEADLFVLCDGGSNTNRSGALGDEFRTLGSAITESSNGDVVMILPQSIVDCAPVSQIITKAITIQGLADPTAPNPPSKPTINGGTAAALIIEGNVKIKDLILRADHDGGTAIVQGFAKASFEGIDARNTDDGGNSSALFCTNDAQVVVDRSLFIDNPKIAIFVKEECQMIAANSLFQRNGGGGGTSSVKVDKANSTADVIYSTFDNNSSDNPGGALMRCDANAGFNGNVINSIANNNQSGPLVNSCKVTFTDTFGVNLLGLGNTNEDPLFVNPAAGDFHLLQGSPVQDTANPLAILRFNPSLPPFNINVFAHDFDLNPRSVGLAPSRGMFEGPN